MELGVLEFQEPSNSPNPPFHNLIFIPVSYISLIIFCCFSEIVFPKNKQSKVSQTLGNQTKQLHNHTYCMVPITSVGLGNKDGQIKPNCVHIYISAVLLLATCIGLFKGLNYHNFRSYHTSGPKKPMGIKHFTIFLFVLLCRALCVVTLGIIYNVINCFVVAFHMYLFLIYFS